MTVATRVIDPSAVRRSRNTGILFILIGIAIVLLFARTAEPGQTARMVLNPARQTAALRIPDVVLPVLPSLYAMAGLSVVLGCSDHPWLWAVEGDPRLGAPFGAVVPHLGGVRGA